MIDDRQTVMLVAGMHRSGTSAISGLMHFLGADVPSDLIPPTIDNPAGYWESAQVVRFHEELLGKLNLTWESVLPISLSFITSQHFKYGQNWIEKYIAEEFLNSQQFLIKDPRLSRFVKLWITALEQVEIQPKIVIPFRHVSEVAYSLDKRDKENEFHSGKGFSFERASLLWLRYMLEVEKDSRNQKRSFVNYHNLIEDWRYVSSKLSKELGIEWSNVGAKVEKQIDSFITPKLNRSKLILDKSENKVGHEWTSKVYSALELLEKDPNHLKAMNMMDEVSAQMKIADDLYGYVLEEANHKFMQEHVTKYDLEQSLLNKVLELERKIESLEVIKNEALREKENELQLLKSYVNILGKTFKGT